MSGLVKKFGDVFKLGTLFGMHSGQSVRLQFRAAGQQFSCKDIQAIDSPPGWASSAGAGKMAIDRDNRGHIIRSLGIGGQTAHHFDCIRPCDIQQGARSFLGHLHAIMAIHQQMLAGIARVRRRWNRRRIDRDNPLLIDKVIQSIVHTASFHQVAASTNVDSAFYHDRHIDGEFVHVEKARSGTMREACRRQAANAHHFAPPG
ncbi:MAG: hypothetical protein L0211_18030 [Planctomycetaceae bacterium]|nr:hypothetical protein [Planctomycetaceae bacterium]